MSKYYFIYSHEAILETRNRLMDEEDMDFNEAVEAAVNQRKYLLNRVFQPLLRVQRLLLFNFRKEWHEYCRSDVKG